MGSKVGIMKIAAKRLGLSLDEYMEHVDKGEKHCGQCRSWKPFDAFHIDRHRGDGLASVCKTCRASPDPYASLRGRVSTFKGHTHKAESRRKMSEAAKNRPSNRTGKKHTEETRRKISEITKERTPRGEDHYAYKHGHAVRNLNDRRIPEYEVWRSAVFDRDGFKCQDCGDSRGGNLRAHHIKPFAEFPELRFEVSNGVTLCHQCHELRHFKSDSIRNQRKLKRGERLWR